MWSTDAWEKRKTKFVQVSAAGRSPSMGDTRVQFHNDQVRLLVVHESQLAVYDAAKLERLRQVLDFTIVFDRFHDNEIVEWVCVAIKGILLTLTLYAVDATKSIFSAPFECHIFM